MQIIERSVGYKIIKSSVSNGGRVLAKRRRRGTVPGECEKTEVRKSCHCIIQSFHTEG